MDSDQKWAWQPASHDAAGSERSQPDFLLDTGAGARPVYTRALAIDEVWNADELLTAFGGIQPAGPSPLVSAIVLHMDGKIEEALAELEAGIAAGWRGLDILTARNQLLYTMGRYQDALAGYEEVRQRDPERAGNAFHRGVCLERLGRYAEAYDAFGEALGRNASDAEALRARGIVELHLERYADALKTFEDCLR